MIPVQRARKPRGFDAKVKQPGIPPQWKAKAELTLKKLKLRDGERVIRWRHRWYQMYLENKLSIEGLEEVAPLLAAAVRRQQAATPRPRRKTTTPRRR